MHALMLQLTAYQQQQVRAQCDSYKASLVTKNISPERTDQACFVFYRTMVEKLFEISRKSVVSKPSQPPPPPPMSQRPHPLAMPQLVDRSSGLLARLLAGQAPPVGLQDWVNRIFASVNQTDWNSRAKATEFVTHTLQALVRNGQLARQNWVAFPVPTVRDLLTYTPGKPISIEPKQTRRSDVIDLEPVQKARKTAPSQDFISFESKQPVPRALKPVPQTHEPVGGRKGRGSATGLDSEEVAKRNQRALKYKEHLLVPGSASPEVPAESVNVKYEFGVDEDDMFEKTEQYAVVGTCMSLEKRYLRLTAAPDPALVRPEPVLRQWLAELEKVWANQQREWKYVEDQMRAIRQDLTVQNVRGSFAARVYELNARWALESGDLGQFNQCQTQLKQLHANLPETDLDTKCEFLSYRLLYYFFQNLRVDEQLFLHQLISEERVWAHPFVKTAMAVRSAATTNNFSKFFRLVREARVGGKHVAPHTKFLLHAFDAKQKIAALVVLSRAIATPIGVAWLQEMLDFETAAACAAFLNDHGAVMQSESHIDPKASFPVFSSSPLLMSSKLKLMG